MIEYVAGYIFDPRKEHVLALHKKTGPAFLRGRIAVPGGKVESNETPLQAIVREIKEETNFDSCESDWKLFAITTVPSTDRKVWFFTTNATRWRWDKIETMTEELVVTIITPIPFYKRDRFTHDFALLAELALSSQFNWPVNLTLSQEPLP